MLTILKWLRSMSSDDTPMAPLVSKFGRMVVSGRHSFDLATDAYLCGADAETINRDVVATDEKINELHQEIRRGLVIHGSLHGGGEFPFSLTMISVAKDAELIGDYAKHICRLALTRPKEQNGAFAANLLDLKSRISSTLGDTWELYESEDEEGATAFVGRAHGMMDECDEKTMEILTSRSERTIDPADPAATVLCYRYYRRIVSHALNIVTSVVLPVDRLDYFDEDKETRGPNPLTEKQRKKDEKKKRKKDKKRKNRK